MTDTMKNEAKADMMSMGSQAASMLDLNGLKYRMPQPLSTGVLRTYKREYAQKQSYTTAAPVIFDFNTGTSYVEPSSALLSFELRLVSSANSTFTWGTGLGGCSLFQEIRIISKNGTEIDRTTEANQLAKVRGDYLLSKSARECLGCIDGYTTTATFELVANTPKTVNVSIPLKLLSGFFRPTNEGMLIPAGLASGLRIEMTLADVNRVFHRIDGVGALVYTIENPEILLQLTDMSDPVQAALMADSAKSGLEYTFPSYFTTVVSNNASTQVTDQIKKAVSQATRLFCAVLDKGAEDVADLDHDGFKSIEPVRISSWQFRVGSSYYPQSQVSRLSEYWTLAMATFNTLRNVEWAPCLVDRESFYNGKAVVGTSLETSDRLNLSGLPINNSSVAELRLKLATNAAIEAYVFLEFISVAKTNINRTTLRI